MATCNHMQPQALRLVATRSFSLKLFGFGFGFGFAFRLCLCLAPRHRDHATTSANADPTNAVSRGPAFALAFGFQPPPKTRAAMPNPEAQDPAQNTTASTKLG